MCIYLLPLVPNSGGVFFVGKTILNPTTKVGIRVYVPTGGKVGESVGERDAIYNAVNSLQWTLALFLRTLYIIPSLGFYCYG